MSSAIESPGRSRPWQAGAEQVLVRLMFTPGSNALEPTHAFLTSYTKERLPPSLAQRICVAAYELLANATNYATIGGDVVLEIVQGLNQLAVRATNSTIPARASILRQQVEKITGDPEGTFVAELRRPLSGSLSRPMLGLARIAHEVGLDLRLDTEGERVTVTAIPNGART